MKNGHRGSILILKYAPFVAVVIMLVHIALLLHGFQFNAAETLVGAALLPAVVCCSWSKSLGFCSMHRCFVWYTWAATYCINYQANGLGFGKFLTPARWIMFAVGLSLVIWARVRCIKYGYSFLYRHNDKR